jgi:serine/threonine protein kinase
MTESSWVGRTLNGRYQIEALLGQGGMSAVYRATDPNLRRVVAAKIIHPHLSNSPDFVRRFEAEAAAVARLRHNNIIQVYDFNHDGSTYYIVFEFVPGETLQAWLRRLNDENRKLPVADTVRIAAAVADALEFAHQQELIHRDVKPANVMINMRGEPILMDFGIAKMVGGTQHTATGAVIGTARYMSPEQIKGERVDARTDLYSLGVMLFEMLSGRAPYESDSAMTMMMMHVQDPVPNVLNLRPDVPPALAQILHRALAKEPQNRYATAAEMAAALRSVVDSPAASPIASTEPAVASPLPVAPSPAAPTAPSPSVATNAPSTPPPPATPSPSAVTAGGGQRKWAIIAGVAAALLLVPLLIFILTTQGGRGEELAAAEPAVEATSIAQEDVEEATAVPSPPTSTPTTAATATTAVVVAAAEPEPTPTPFPEVTITNVALVSDVYVVQYNVVGFQESPDGLHLHFFFTTTPPREAGRPFSDFFMYAGPSPYAELRLADRPEGATQICALVANPDHTIQGESGNCFNLPPAPEVSVTVPPTAGGTTGGAGETAVGDALAAPALSVRITDVREEGGTYLVEYTTTGFTEQLPGVHIHFFFDTVAPEDAGLPSSGPWYVWGGPRPFDGYQVADKPAGARQMCALVANPDHTIQPDSGNCVYLPGHSPYDS